MSGQSDTSEAAAPAGPADLPFHPAAGVAWVLGAVALLVWLQRRGVLREAWLRGTPRRLPPLGGWDLLAAVGLFFVGSVVAMGLAEAVLGPNPLGRPDASPWAMVLLQLGTFGLPSAWVVWRAQRVRGGLRRLGFFFRWGHLRTVLVALPAGWLLASGVLVVAALAAQGLGLESPVVQHELLLTLQERPGWRTLAPAILSAVVLAPLLEEILLRGLVQSLCVRVLGRRRRWAAIACASAGFAALHLGSVPPQTLAGLFVLGVVFGAVYERTGSLTPAVLVHAGFNAFNVAVVAAGLAG
ncbi:CPBP family intramembrane glutamic endopeptidase [Phycisphaera mikurensis]|uniref:CAAX prenyl protease 2/Lysostaphin resistance protein A-like domain-containing protein n=1 Tax=Phycisphaera mikurensis (strain NBRC 102666 / KCTC 22515 / FYK2301M01) TaxID=1142394 RepID=I0IF62_PHYMF|nr:CPBP family intramembrane glutamic endopeptidase [Phycisphaera mikurensis]MBB6440704.1 hypothetical protein [Phycisphaera mikurensis]BAM03900.1 hypothetical protein PSMK_17410 [Phycisphaera mikurensis NBRC 102666]